MFLALSILLFALAAFDAYVSRRRMVDYGLWVENNKAIQFLAVILGPELGTVVGVVIPTLASIALCWIFQWIVPIALLVGFRANYAFVQCRSLAFEKQVKNSVANSKKFEGH